MCRGSSDLLVRVTSAQFLFKNPEAFVVLKWLNNCCLNFFYNFKLYVPGCYEYNSFVKWELVRVLVGDVGVLYIY